MQTRVLVLMATYNGSRFIREQLDSIFAQKKVEVHVLARDDGSSDDTLKILHDYKKMGFNLDVIDAKNDKLHGPMMNYYALLQLAQKKYATEFEYFALSDQDDIWLPQKLHTMITSATLTDKPELLYGNYQIIDEQGNVTIADADAQIGLNFDNSLSLLYSHSYAWGHSILFNQELLQSVCLDDEVCQSNFPHDAYLSKFAAICDGIKYVPDVLVQYRRYNGNASGMWYHVNILHLFAKLNILKNSKIFANVVNCSLFTIEKNQGSKFANQLTEDQYKQGISLRGIKLIRFFKQNQIYRKQRSRNANLYLVYALGIYAHWTYRKKKMRHI